MALLAVAAVAEVPAAPPAQKELSLRERRDARKIYVTKCAKCHRFYEPNDYDSVTWSRWMESMGEQSKLKTAQRELLGRYLEEYRAGKLKGKPQDKP